MPDAARLFPVCGAQQKLAPHLRCRKLPACARVLNAHLSFASRSLRGIPIGWFGWREGGAYTIMLAKLTRG